METRHDIHCTVFEGSRRVASGVLAHVILAAKEIVDRGGHAPVLIFDDVTSETIEVDFRGPGEEVLQRHANAMRRFAGATAAPAPQTVAPEAVPRGPGRPKLGVVAREVTLLPRHWEWLNGQPGGASVALRKLVDEARRRNDGKDRVRQAREAAYRFMSVMAGNERGFEEATRALFAGHRERFDAFVASWPADVRDHVKRLAADVFEVPAA